MFGHFSTLCVTGLTFWVKNSLPQLDGTQGMEVKNPISPNEMRSHTYR